MPNKLQVAIIGLGRFGSNVARTLFQSGHDVLGIDINEERVQEMQGKITYAVQGDATQQVVLNELGVKDYNAAVVAIGDDLGQSITATVLLKSLEIPDVYSRSHSDIHKQTIEKLEARPISVEEDMGSLIAYRMTKPNISEYMEISENFGISQVKIGNDYRNRTLREIGIKTPRDKYSISIIALRHNENITISPSLDTILYPGDTITVCGNDEDVSRFSN